ncbi:MerR family DNA-binding transcriptional regulator [Paenibacillus oceani]|uniref:MerR family DNA-binding transcriptional regulator n=1 Tax=Paenibacillus oceani TaxID=2772510 RepID=A0A927CFU2_9BACL|nr:MerR family DNA-binding transcriptional regulator [Paenibacillus oceani]MBD2866775.1 MerR family DNA-binding transcriptional regulator [Paenibacillus oceani]
MEPVCTPKQLADQLKVSTTTLRRYEDQDLIPDVPRTDSNRRGYRAVHVQAFVSIRALLKGFGIPVVYEVMRKVKAGREVEGLWLLNQQLHDSHVEKQRVESTLTLFRQTDLSVYRNKPVTDSMTIGEVAEICGVRTSAIRHWEKEGLIRSERNLQNGYRVFSSRELRKLIVISSLRKTVFFIDSMKQLLHDLDTQNLASVEQSFQLALDKLNVRLTAQYQGIAELMNYIQRLTLHQQQGPS